MRHLVRIFRFFKLAIPLIGLFILSLILIQNARLTEFSIPGLSIQNFNLATICIAFLLVGFIIAFAMFGRIYFKNIFELRHLRKTVQAHQDQLLKTKKEDMKLFGSAITTKD